MFKKIREKSGEYIVFLLFLIAVFLGIMIYLHVETSHTETEAEVKQNFVRLSEERIDSDRLSEFVDTRTGIVYLFVSDLSKGNSTACGLTVLLDTDGNPIVLEEFCE